MRTWLMVYLMCVVAGMVSAGEEAVTPSDMASWRIVCDPAGTECERYAATEFQELFQEMAGTVLPIDEKAEPDMGSVFIGPDAVAGSDEGTHTEELGEEGLHISVGQNAVRIYGGRPRGTLYGVYEFFEELCGVRYLTHDHTHFPENGTSVTIPSGTHTYTPPFAFRWSYYGETNRNPEFAARLRTNTVSGDTKLGGITGYRLVSHNVADLVPPAEYGEEHPEYYALVDGRRQLTMHGGGPQLCMTNPGVLEIVVKAVLKAIEKNPSVKNFNVAHMDNVSFCTCADCAAIDAREESHAGATLAFVNAVAERIEKTHPDVLISTYAYQYTRKPPKTIRARNNVMIQLCSIECCDFHPIDDPACARNQEFCEDMAGWKKKSDHIFIWHYNTNFKGYLLPFPNLRSIGKSVAYFEKNNGRGVFMQAAGNGFSTELSDLRNYVMSRCLWKPGRDSWQEAEEFCRLHYREAAKPILDYLKYYHDLVGAEGLHPGCFPTESELGINPETSRHITAYFREALSLAQSEEVRERVEKASLCAGRAALSAACMKLAYDIGVCRPAIDKLEPDLLDHYAAQGKKYGVVMDNERTGADAYLDEMRKLYAGMKAVRLENETWRVVLLPESNAKTIEMTYKPTGRNVIQPTRSLDRFRYEEWVRQGEGPRPDDILAYQVQAQPDKAFLNITAKDGARIVRSVVLAADAIRVETTMTAKSPRPFDFHVHPEYDSASRSDNPEVVGIYFKDSDWIHANKGWRDAQPTEEQSELIRKGVAGGVFAYFNHSAMFGVEQSFDPQEFDSIGLFWSPARLQINLEMFPRAVSLEQEQQGHYAYEIRYLTEAPETGTSK